MILANDIKALPKTAEKAQNQPQKTKKRRERLR
jgi:hypothetical protein